jgi:hypothetical protein
MSAFAAHEVWSRTAHDAWHWPALMSNMQLLFCAQHVLVTHAVSQRGVHDEPLHEHVVSVSQPPDVAKEQALMHWPAWRFHVQLESAEQEAGVTYRYAHCVRHDPFPRNWHIGFAVQDASDGRRPQR